jgi:N6-L-threonylcarbamoyladenine synthase
MRVLGIETSCDETSAAVVNQNEILSNIIATQAIHQNFGGVVPEFASRAHIQLLNPIIKEALKKSNTSMSKIDGIAVTYGPGLAGSLLVGLCVAKGLCIRHKIPLMGVNHIEGHILALFSNQRNIAYPFICLVASGGHTLFVFCPKHLEFKIIGQTIDDAAGEAFDKVSKILQLGYPGGPAIESTAETGDENSIKFPIGLDKKDNINFSFSGLKTAVLYYAQSLKNAELVRQLPNIAASFQNTVIESLLSKSLNAVQLYKCKSFIIAGGVARNKSLRKKFQAAMDQSDIEFYVPEPELCTDNAAMIARAGQLHLELGQNSPLDLDIVPNLTIK